MRRLPVEPPHPNASPRAVAPRGLARARLCARRDFIGLAAVAATAFLGTAPGCAGDETTTEPPPAPSDFDLPSLGGAPDTPQGRIVAAFVDTVVPGRWRDPEGAPGGIDVGAPGMFFDPELPAAQFLGVLALVLDALAKGRFPGRGFAALHPDERDQVLEEALADPTSPMIFAVQLAKLAAFSAPGIGRYLGYPGPNPGYVDDADFTFGVAMATEITTDGNLP
ncbi:MAG: hypothetical protein IT373_27755 [Polyangiaceae bacterium]|nr:hypothetical protein [Polyangiaceae bacterium]